MTTPLQTQALIPTSVTEPADVVKYSTLGAHALTFLCGILAVLLSQNFVGGETSTFSTSSLISFLFGIALSAASTVLAIAAITLGKSSERTMIDRSDASIRLQNEVFTKTTEALARIESSTGVTEKRIEDIISGRAGELSHAIAERLGASGGAKAKDRDVLEQEIKESLIDQLSESKALQLQQRAETRKKTEEGEKRYKTFQTDLLLTLANSGVGTCEKVGEGSFTAEGADLFDAILTVGNARIGVSAFSTEPGVAGMHLKHLSDFLLTSVKEIAAGRFQHVVIAVDGATASDGKYRKTLSDTLSAVKEDIVNKVHLVDGADHTAKQHIVETVRAILAGGTSVSQVPPPK